MRPTSLPSQGADGVLRTAVWSACGEHRLLLERRWERGPLVLFVMLNPSTADATRDDPTIRRCLAFARRWGFGGLLVANLYTLRATDPRDLARAPAESRTTASADAVLGTAAARCALVVEAWGAHRARRQREDTVRGLLAAAGAPRCDLGRTRDGAPRHPLYVPGRTRPVDVVRRTPVRLPHED